MAPGIQRPAAQVFKRMKQRSVISLTYRGYGAKEVQMPEMTEILLEGGDPEG